MNSDGSSYFILWEETSHHDLNSYMKNFHIMPKIHTCSTHHTMSRFIHHCQFIDFVFHTHTVHHTFPLFILWGMSIIHFCVWSYSQNNVNVWSHMLNIWSLKWWTRGMKYVKKCMNTHFWLMYSQMSVYDIHDPVFSDACAPSFSTGTPRNHQIFWGPRTATCADQQPGHVPLQARYLLQRHLHKTTSASLSVPNKFAPEVFCRLSFIGAGESVQQISFELRQDREGFAAEQAVVDMCRYIDVLRILSAAGPNPHWFFKSDGVKSLRLEVRIHSLM